MKLDAKALGIACGLLWGGCLLVVGLAAVILGPKEGSYYGQDFLLAMASVYPGYKGVPQVGDVFVGALYGLVDGVIAGLLLAWLYNLCSSKRAA